MSRNLIELPSPAANSENGKCFILLVEDDFDHMAVLRDIVSAIPEIRANLLFAYSAAEASKLLASSRVDVVISDILMPGTSGLELLEQAVRSGHYQPFIFITSLQSREAAIHAIRLGAFDYIEKPIDRRKIETPLRKAIQVSLAYRALEKELAASLPDQENPSLRKAAQELLKLRAMRFQNADPDVFAQGDFPRAYRQRSR